jgi:hypothetical protein
MSEKCHWTPILAAFFDRGRQGGSRTNCLEALDILHQPPENNGNSRKNLRLFLQLSTCFMTPSQPSPSPEKKVTPEQCKHPRVRIVSRDEDSEYVECQECGDVFESSELKDMAIEEKKEPEEE